jgi:hypothetical protein
LVIALNTTSPCVFSSSSITDSFLSLNENLRVYADELTSSLILLEQALLGHLKYFSSTLRESLETLLASSFSLFIGGSSS